MKVTYETSSAQASQLPDMSLPEIALIGRSNVGKSSLINAMLNVGGLARTSRTPGRTRMANFFRVDDTWYIVDLPGYGFSKATNADHKLWQDLIDTYLKRTVIHRFIFLWDIRRDFTSVDIRLANDLASLAPLTLVLTKCDKLSRSETSHRRKIIELELERNKLPIRSLHTVSALRKLGTEDLLKDVLTP